jgi:nucleotide-binding universal stress UspA family protein
MNAQDRPRIVVGVDGSPPSNAALKWAVDEAKLLDATVEAVHAWQIPATYGWGPVVATPSLDLSESAEATVTEALTEVFGDEVPENVKVIVKEGQAAYSLIEASAGAHLLVVGSHGRGGFAGMLLGSVSQQCVQHASCPVVVIREK